MKAPKRDLSDIADDIRAELKRDTAGIIKLGGLLAEAKRQVKAEGRAWLPWIEENFSMSEATVQRYLQVHKFLQSRTVRDLEAASNLSASALYDLSAKHCHAVYTPKAIEAIFNEAQQKRVGADRAYEIAWSLQPQPQTEAEFEAESQAAEEQEAAEQAEAEAILDGPPPELPPPEPPAPVDFVVPAFDQAISKLKELSTKHSDKFLGSTHPASDIEAIGEFLFHIAQTKAKAAA